MFIKRIWIVLCVIVTILFLFVFFYTKPLVPFFNINNQTIGDHVSSHPSTNPENNRQNLITPISNSEAGSDSIASSNDDPKESTKVKKDKNGEPYAFRGLDVSMERFVQERRKIFLELGVPPPFYPYQAHIEKIYKIVEERGYRREELFESFTPILESITKLTNFEMQRAKRTYELFRLFENGEKEEIERIIRVRLEKNEHDIPALLMRLNLHNSQLMIEELFQDVEAVVVALDYFEPRGVDKRAILYYVLTAASTWAYTTENGLKGFRERSRGKLDMGSVDLLRPMEVAGDW